MKNIFSLIILAFYFIVVSSCSEDDKPDTGSIEIEFDNVVSDQDLVLNTATEVYTNANGETYKVSTLHYYISNMKLKMSDGSVFTDEVSEDGAKGYYLIDEADGESQRVELKNVPVGDYTEITFTVGVDAAKISGTPSGALDPDHGMFWNSIAGYIFMKLEGTASASTHDNKEFLYHVGGFIAPDNNIRTKTVLMGATAAQVRSNQTPEVHVIVDVNKFFAAPHQISFAELPIRYMPSQTKAIADNYSNTFIVDHVHN